MNEGLDAICLNLAAGAHQLSFSNDHLPELGVYLANALVPATNAIKINKQERDTLQRELRINFHATTDHGRGRLDWAGVLVFCLCLALLLPQWKRLLQT